MCVRSRYRRGKYIRDKEYITKKHSLEDSQTVSTSSKEFINNEILGLPCLPKGYVYVKK